MLKHVFILRAVPFSVDAPKTVRRTVGTSPLLGLKITAQYNRSIALTLAEVDSRNVGTVVARLVA